MIAMALALEPAVLIADEPSTALDVTIQAQIIELLQDLNQEHGLSVILITHDLGVVAEIADRVLVMYAGQVVEQASLDEIFYDPQHPYTWGLLGSIARLDQDAAERLPQIGGQPPSLLAPPPGCRFAPRCPHAFEKCSELPALEERLPKANDHADRCWLDPKEKQKLREVDGRIGLEAPEVRRLMAKGDPILEVEHLVKYFPIKSGIFFDRTVASVKAVDDVSLTLHEGETLGLVGESGLRQVDSLPDDHPAARADRGLREVPRQGADRPLAQEVGADQARDPDDLPGPVRLAQPAQAGGADHRRPAAAARARLRDPAPPRGPAADGQGGPSARALQPLPARVLGRPAAADRHRPGARAAARS